MVSDMLVEDPQFICCFCNGKFNEYGNNAEPLRKGTCCDECNFDVIFYRLCVSNKIPLYGHRISGRLM